MFLGVGLKVLWRVRSRPGKSKEVCVPSKLGVVNKASLDEVTLSSEEIKDELLSLSIKIIKSTSSTISLSLSQSLSSTVLHLKRYMYVCVFISYLEPTHTNQLLLAEGNNISTIDFLVMLLYIGSFLQYRFQMLNVLSSPLH